MDYTKLITTNQKISSLANQLNLSPEQLIESIINNSCILTMDSIQSFLSESIVYTGDIRDSVKGAKIFNKYQYWCMDKNIFSESKYAFYRCISELNMQTVTTNNSKAILGIKLIKSN